MSKKPVRVALVCEPPDGGVAAHVRWLARGLPAHGYEPVVVVPHNFAHLDELGNVCEVVTLPFRRDYSHPQDELRAMGRLLPVLRRTTLVHAHSAKAGVLARVVARLARKPAVYTPHLFPFIGEIPVARKRFGLFVERALAPSTAALICVCEFERGLALQKRLRPRRVAMIHNGCPPCSDGDLADMPEGLIVGTLAVLRPQKALGYILDAMPAIKAAVPEAKLVIVGDGPAEPKLHAHAVDLGLDVTWLPFAPPPARYLRSFDVYVLSSAWEAFPISVLEAQACGVPQVVSAVGGTRESVVPETGIVVPPGDPEALAEAVIQLLRDPERRATMGEASRARQAECFTVERMVADTAAVYDRVIADT
ncbi:MAG TPA: glycosyltransferase [Mycobacterium sp.]|nr:glycosyltransferase [Mycobacterium sp.]